MAPTDTTRRTSMTSATPHHNSTYEESLSANTPERPVPSPLTPHDLSLPVVNILQDTPSAGQNPGNKSRRPQSLLLESSGTRSAFPQAAMPASRAGPADATGDCSRTGGVKRDNEFPPVRADGTQVQHKTSFDGSSSPRSTVSSSRAAGKSSATAVPHEVESDSEEDEQTKRMQRAATLKARKTAASEVGSSLQVNQLGQSTLQILKSAMKPRVPEVAVASTARVAVAPQDPQDRPHKCTLLNPTTNEPCDKSYLRQGDLTRHENAFHKGRSQEVRRAAALTIGGNGAVNANDITARPNELSLQRPLGHIADYGRNERVFDDGTKDRSGAKRRLPASPLPTTGRKRGRTSAVTSEGQSMAPQPKPLGYGHSTGVADRDQDLDLIDTHARRTTAASPEPQLFAYVPKTGFRRRGTQVAQAEENDNVTNDSQGRSTGRSNIAGSRRDSNTSSIVMLRSYASTKQRTEALAKARQRKSARQVNAYTHPPDTADLGGDDDDDNGGVELAGTDDEGTTDLEKIEREFGMQDEGTSQQHSDKMSMEPGAAESAQPVPLSELDEELAETAQRALEYNVDGEDRVADWVSLDRNRANMAKLETEAERVRNWGDFMVDQNKRLREIERQMREMGPL